MSECVYVSENIEDLKRELDHAKLLHVALCPYEARTVIAMVAIKALDAMMEKEVGHPADFLPAGIDWEHITDEQSDQAQANWNAALNSMKFAFELSLGDKDQYEWTPEEWKQYDEGMLNFATYFLHLWV